MNDGAGDAIGFGPRCGAGVPVRLWLGLVPGHDTVHLTVPTGRAGLDPTDGPLCDQDGRIRAVWEASEHDMTCKRCREYFTEGGGAPIPADDPAAIRLAHTIMAAHVENSVGLCASCHREWPCPPAERAAGILRIAVRDGVPP